jgi:hypothetical protein
MATDERVSDLSLLTSGFILLELLAPQSFAQPAVDPARLIND